MVLARHGVLLLLLIGIAPAVAWAKPSCGSGGPLGQGTDTAGTGSYRYSVPASYNPGQAIPLLLALHGDEGTPDYIYSVFRGLQSSSGGAFILVAPKAPFGGGSWYQATSQHESFIDQVIAQQLKRYNIDQDRLWITGWSGGATFLGYYAIKRQDILGAVVYHMGGGGGGSYSPPPGSCKIAGRFVIGSADFLHNLAQKQYNTMKANGHEVTWVELPGVGHKFQQSTLAGTWSWLQQKTLCNTTTPGSCGPQSPPTPDASAPAADAGVPIPGDVGAAPADAVPPTARVDGGGAQADALRLERTRSADDALRGGCSAGGGPASLGGLLFVLTVLGLLRARSSRF